MKVKRGYLLFRPARQPDVFRVSEVLSARGGVAQEQQDVFEGDYAACRDFIRCQFWRAVRAYLILVVGTLLFVIAPMVPIMRYLFFGTDLHAGRAIWAAQWLGVSVMIMGMLLATRERRALPSIPDENLVIDLRPYDAQGGQ